MRSHAKAPSAGPTQRRAGGLGRFGLVVPIIVLAALLSLSVSSASATITRELEPFSPLEGSSVGATLHELSGIALDEETGNVFVSDGGESEEGVVILGGEGGTPSGLVSPFTIPDTAFFGGNTAAFLAYDNSPTSPAKGTLYAYNNEGIYSAGAEEGAIKKYRRNPVSERYEEVAGDEIVVPGCSFGAGGGVDGEGNVYFGCSGLNTIYEFSPAGTKLHEYELWATPITSPGQIAVDAAGDLFVQQQAGGVYKLPVNGSGEVEPSNYTPVTENTTTGVAYEPEANEIVVAENHGVEEFNATTLAKIGEFGGEVFTIRTERVALDLKTHRVYIADYSHKNVAVFGPDVIVPTTRATAATNIAGTKATLNGSVDPEGIAITECFFEWGETTEYDHKTTDCEGSIPSDSEAHSVSADISGLVSNGVTYHYRLVAKNANGTSKSADKTLVSGNTVITEAATDVGTTTATLNGTLRPEGVEFSDCRFEYKLRTAASYEDVPCEPGAEEIEADFAEHSVSAALDELQLNSTYEFRLTATNPEATHSGQVLTFTTSGPPQIGEVRALNATQSSVTLEGKINPSGFGTSYRFEWGPTASYGHQVPAEFEPYVGDGTTPVRVSAQLTGLSAGTAYHYRIVATSSAGATASPEQIAETLNSCGLIEGRCFELVSRRDAGPVGIPGENFAPKEMHFQAATAGPGALAYEVESGYPEATKGAEVLYRATRGASGWESVQLSTPISELNERGDVESGSGITEWLSNDLSCGFAQSWQQLTDDPSTRMVRELGGTNLYRLNPDNSDNPYTAVSYLAPENPGPGGYVVGGASQDCGKVLFISNYHYPGVPGAGNERLYEWDEGTLRNAGIVPGPSGETVVEATPGAPSRTDFQNTVSEDGSRIFFSAQRQTSPNPAEIGTTGVFVREDGTTTRDVSLSETSTPDEGATYQWATPDGSKVFFTANAGLTADSSPEGTDLYVYDLETEELTDLSVEHEAGGAQVVGFLGAAEDGSHVYFAAAGQLVPGRGKTLAQNQSEEMLSVYGESNGEVSYVGAVNGSFNELRRVLIANQSEWSSRVSPDGRYLIFQSSTNVTGYDSGGPFEVYLYDAEGGSEGTVCVSCRQDGQPSVAPENYELLPADEATNNLTHPPQFLAEREGKPQVFFSSPDALAPGAVEHQNNVYEWSHGQVVRLTSARKGQEFPDPIGGYFAAFVGASQDGTDAYLITPETLNWEDGDERLSAYDARIGGGGFPEPPPPPPSCEATAEGSCQGPAQVGPSTPGAASAAFSGPGNPAPRALKPKKKAHKKKHATKKHKRHSKRHANADRRAGK